MIRLLWTMTTTVTTLLVSCLLFPCSIVSSFTVVGSRNSHRRRLLHHRHDESASITTATAKTTIRPIIIILSATVADDETQQQQSSSSSTSSSVSDNEYDSSPWKHKVLTKMSLLRKEAMDYATRYDLTFYEATVYALFQALRLVQVPLGLNKQGGQPIVWRRQEIVKAMQLPPQSDADAAAECGAAGGWSNFFTMDDLEKAVKDDFLDAARGSTDNRKGWKVCTYA